MRRQSTSKTVFVIVGGVWLLCIGGAYAQVQTIWIPSGSGGTSNAQVTVDQPCIITTTDGVKHTIKKVSISGLNNHRSKEMGFSDEESQTYVAFVVTSPGVYSATREELDKKHWSYFWVFIPISSIDSIKALNLGDDHRDTTVAVVTRVTTLKLPSPLAIHEGVCSFDFNGSEDMGDFGQARFKDRISPDGGIKEVIFPLITYTPNASNKNSLTAEVTEVSGKKHVLKDIRLPSDNFTFWRNNSELHLPPVNVQKVEVLRPTESLDFVCSVTLKTGAQQELIWKTTDVDQGIGGKSADNMFELIPLKAIKTIEFISSNKE